MWSLQIGIYAQLASLLYTRVELSAFASDEIRRPELVVDRALAAECYVLAIFGYLCLSKFRGQWEVRHCQR